MGLALHRAGVARELRGGAVLLLVAANLPDADSIAGAPGQLHYLEFHRGITHSLAGIALQAVLLGLLASLLAGRGRPRTPGAYLLASAIGLLSHPLLDHLNSYGWRPWLPWSNRWIHGDALFIIDPWLWLLLCLGAAAGSSTRALRAGLAALGFPTLAFGALIAGRMTLPGALRFAPAAALLLVFLLAPRLAAIERRRGARLALGAALAWIATARLLGSLALSRAEGDLASHARSAHPVHLAALPLPLSPLHWRVVARDGARLGVAEVSLLAPGRRTRFEWLPDRLELAPAAAAAATCAGQAMLRFQRFPYAELSRTRHGHVVLLRDARFSWNGERADFATLRLELDEALRPRSLPPCPRAPHGQAGPGR